MKVIGLRELEGLVRKTFPARGVFSAESELGLHASRPPVVGFVHGGADPLPHPPVCRRPSGSAPFVSGSPPPAPPLPRRRPRAGRLRGHRASLTRRPARGSATPKPS